MSYVPTTEATEEFRVQTTNFDAQYGWTLGGVINIITKNGTNESQGSAFKFLDHAPVRQHLQQQSYRRGALGHAD